MADGKLTAKQEAFCREYLIDLNATQAAIRAGYSEKTAKDIACENLAKPNISQKIAELSEARSKRTEVDADYVLKRAKMIHESCWNEGDAKNSIAALKLVGDHIAVQAFKQQVSAEHSGPGGGPIQISDISEQELDDRLKEMGYGRKRGQLDEKSTDA